MNSRNTPSVQSGILMRSALIVAFSCLSTSYATTPWNQIHKIIATDGATSDFFGNSVAASGNLSVVGAFWDDDLGKNSGSTYIYDITTGKQLFKLNANDGAADDRFGNAVAASGNLAVIGAWFDDDKGSGSGSAYVFDINTGQQIFKLLASDGAAGDGFGFSVAIDGNLAVIGAINDDDNGTNSGSAYVFDITNGQQLFKLLATDGAASDTFGNSVAVSGNNIIIGAPLVSDNGSASGAIYVFDALTGQQISKIIPSDNSKGDNFGFSVALTGSEAAIGAIRDNDNGTSAGSAYVFDISTGQQLFKLLANDGASNDFFGNSVSINGNLILIGAPSHDHNGIKSGSAYMFDRNTGNLLFELIPANGNSGDEFGVSVSLSGNLAAIGATFADGNVTDSGSEYIFRSCLQLAVTNLVAGQNAVFTITNGIPGSKAATVYGLKAGETIANDILGYCATFGIGNLSKSKIIGGLNHIFDGNGEITFNQFVPMNTQGIHVFFQSAMQNTCPDECISDLIDMTVQ